MKTKNKWMFVAGLSALTLALMLSLSAVSLAGGTPTEPAATESRDGLRCSVSNSVSNGIKLVTLTNQTDRVLTKGTIIKFGADTGVETSKSLPKNLKPGRTAVIHLGRFDGGSCRCQLVQ